MIVDLFGIPNARMETGGSSVEVVWSVVHREVILFAVELEFAFGDAIAVASHECGEEGLGRIHAAVDVVVSLNHIGVFAFAVSRIYKSVFLPPISFWKSAAFNPQRA